MILKSYMEWPALGVGEDPSEAKLVRVMEQPVKDRVSQCGIPESLMPVLHRELTRDQGRASPVPVLQEFKYVASVLITERRQPPVIENQ